MNEREKLLRNVQVYQFALMEAAMFLDTHPGNQEALDYFKKYLKLTKQAVDAYTEKYGPLSANDISDDTKTWDWIKGPWPWEGTK